MKNYEEKRLAIYGCSRSGSNLWIRYFDKIDYFIDRKAKSLQEYYGVPVYEYKDVVNRNNFIIVATTWENYIKIREEMELSGKIEGKDFIFYEFIKKKMVIVYGNCHMIPFKEYLNNNEEFQRKYFAIYVNVMEAKNLLKYLINCHLLIMQDIRDDNEVNAPGMQKIFSIFNRNKIIVIPNLYGLNLFWPQLMLHKKEYLKIIDKTEVFYHMIGIPDKFIQKKYFEKSEIQNCVKMIYTQKIISSDVILKNFEKGIETLQVREKICDICISDYILNKYKEEQLFFEPFHPTNNLIFEKARRVLEYLGIKEMKPCLKISTVLDGGEVFIYDCVRKTLNLKWKQEKIRRTTGSNLDNYPLSLEEYIEQYYKVMNILEKRYPNLRKELQD